jgi:hypothetical protein
VLATVLLIAAAGIVGGVLAVATGRGGEMAMFPRQLPAVPLALRTPADVAAVQLPHSVFGYQPEATSAVLNHLARLLAERDAEIARLRGDE